MQRALIAPSVAVRPEQSRRFAWLVFALMFGLLLSDYMSRQVLNAVFPLLKNEWALSDAQLGLLSSVVAFTAGLLSFPLSVIADKFGRVKSVVVMAMLWSLATLVCGMAQRYEHILAARLIVGMGEAAYGSVGLAIILSAFPVRLRATLTGVFLAGAMLGAVLGLGVGGAIAGKHGWRMAFYVMAVIGLVITAMFVAFVRENKLTQPAEDNVTRAQGSASIKNLITNPVLLTLYAACGFQFLVSGALIAWLPTFFHRVYGYSTQQSAVTAAMLVLCSGVGMTFCGIVCDRYFSKNSEPIRVAMLFCLISCGILLISFHMVASPVQIAMIAFGMFFVTGVAGPTGAFVTAMSHPSIHATALATLALANNLIGLASGPFLTGVLADKFGLQIALKTILLSSLVATVMYFIANKLFQNVQYHPAQN